MTPADAAKWMKGELSSGELYQEAVASELLGHADDDLAYYDDSGNACIGKKVLAEFKKMTPDVVYSRSGKYWRMREGGDEPTRMQY
jgi:hypothetical protein